MLSDDAIEWLNERFVDIPSWALSCKEEYFDGWTSYEESCTALIFSDNDKFYMIEHFCCVLDSNPNYKSPFNEVCEEISFEHACETIDNLAEIQDSICF